MSLDVYLYKNKTALNSDSAALYENNITHNLNTMAEEAGIYKALWRPEELGFKRAKDLIPLLTIGLQALNHNPSYFKNFNPENGWGDYNNLKGFVEDYLKACKDYPSSIILISR